MQFKWLNKENNKNLILFLNGWAMNESAVANLEKDGFDILMLSDYRNVDFGLTQFDFEKYDKKYLVCWSMGVYVSNLFKEELDKFDKKIAINGTNKIIDNDFGIPEKIYKVTTKFLNESSLDKFIKNMFDAGNLNPSIIITKSVEELREELISIQKIELSEELKFDYALISNDDRIVPTKNQIAFWQNKAPYKLINSTHCPFEIFKSWREIIC